MQQQAGTVPTYIALGLAVLAAISSVPRQPPDLDAALLWLLSAESSAIDLPPPTPDGRLAVVGP